MQSRSWSCTILTSILLAVPCAAQSVSRDDVLRLIPPDTGLCLIVSDLREHSAKLDQSPWLKALAASPVGKHFLASPESRKLARFQADLKQHLQLDWPRLRDDI